VTDTQTITEAFIDPRELQKRIEKIVNAATAGPPADEHLPVPAVVDAPHFVDGVWSKAKRVKCHPGRMGGAIAPYAIVVHTTDMLPNEWDSLLTAWTSKSGEGACAHFIIGRDESAGVVQMVPISRNGNHAGGPGSGRFVVNGKEVHPNLVTVGIEVHCAGGVRLVNGAWRLVEDGVAHGAPLPASDVTPDPLHPGRGWHHVTDYQRDRLFELLADLDAVLAPLPPGTTTRAFGEAVAPYAMMPTARIVTHAQLDPVHRADPWPPLCNELKKLAP
jgi:hypothetical protein